MINYATDAPPESITINGTVYPAKTDYRVWLQVSDLLCNLDSASDQDAITHNLNTVRTLETLVFGCVLNEPVLDVLNACAEFYRGYPAEGNGYRPETDSTTGEKLFSFKHDINLILIAIRNQSGIDLSYRRKEPYHWWLFLLEFRSLESRHHICQVIGWLDIPATTLNCSKSSGSTRCRRNTPAMNSAPLMRWNAFFTQHDTKELVLWPTV